MGVPHHSKAPASGRRRPAKTRNRVDLPAPLGPVSSMASPAHNVRLISFSTSLSPRKTRKDSAASRAVQGGAEERGAGPSSPCPGVNKDSEIGVLLNVTCQNPRKRGCSRARGHVPACALPECRYVLPPTGYQAGHPKEMGERIARYHAVCRLPERITSHGL